MHGRRRGEESVEPGESAISAFGFPGQTFGDEARKRGDSYAPIDQMEEEKGGFIESIPGSYPDVREAC